MIVLRSAERPAAEHLGERCSERRRRPHRRTDRAERAEIPLTNLAREIGRHEAVTVDVERNDRLVVADEPERLRLRICAGRERFGVEHEDVAGAVADDQPLAGGVELQRLHQPDRIRRDVGDLSAVNVPHREPESIRAGADDAIEP